MTDRPAAQEVATAGGGTHPLGPAHAVEDAEAIVRRMRAFMRSNQAIAGAVFVIGAVVGVQPFGGEGLSGTGFKAGGPHYLPRFGTEVTVSNNIAAVGGNASLLSLESD